jgi:hypothetical protein
MSALTDRIAEVLRECFPDHPYRWYQSAAKRVEAAIKRPVPDADDPDEATIREGYWHI